MIELTDAEARLLASFWDDYVRVMAESFHISGCGRRPCRCEPRVSKKEYESAFDRLLVRSKFDPVAARGLLVRMRS